MLPTLFGEPIRVEIKASLGPHLAATFIPQRLILLDRQVLQSRGEFERILIHEIFHFAWVRLGNPKRRAWEDLLAAELSLGVKGELGWSAEWRKSKLTRAKIRGRSLAWRQYACESFCDTAAWAYAGIAKHDEFTLPSPQKRLRLRWYSKELGTAPVAC